MNNSRQIYKFASIISSVIEPWRDFDSMDNRIDEKKKKKERKRKEKKPRKIIFLFPAQWTFIDLIEEEIMSLKLARFGTNR